MPYDNTRAALEEFDRTKPDREVLFNLALDTTTMQEWLDAEEAARRKVCEAFQKDTAEYNSLDRVMMMLWETDFAFIRRIVANSGVH